MSRAGARVFAAAIGLTSSASPLYAQCAYTVTVVAEPVGWSIMGPRDMSEDGLVVGKVGFPGDPTYSAFTWRADVGFQVLPRPINCVSVDPTRVSESGSRIVGVAYLAGLPDWKMQMVLYTDGVPLVFGLTDPPTGYSVECVNDSGLAIAWDQANLQGAPTFWLDGQPTSIPSSVPAGTVQTLDVTDFGWFAGIRWPQGAPSAHTAFIASADQLIDLPQIPGMFGETAERLNRRLHAIVQANVLAPRPGAVTTMSYLVADGVVTNLGTWPGKTTTACVDLNDVDQVVGACGGIDVPGPKVPFLWQNGTLYDLRTLAINLPTDITIDWPFAVNNVNGTIAATAYKQFLSKERLVLFEPLTTDEDVTLDCHVDAKDLLLVLESWGPVGPMTVQRADVDRNGEVDGYDLAAVLGAWTGR